MLEGNVKKMISRKAQGAAKNNRCEVRELIEGAKRYADGICVFKDRADNVIYVDTQKGITAKIVKVINPETGLEEIDYKWYEDGSNSSKNNGYVYTTITIIGLKGKKEVYRCGTHTLIAMLAHTAEYDVLDAVGLTPIANHEDNCGWNNKADNLDWCTQAWNIVHGKILHSLHRQFNGTYTHIENNLSDVDFVVLDEKLTVDNIRDYLDYVDNKYEFKTADQEYIEADVLNAFVDWLIDNGIWTGYTYEEQCI